jgi:hypothetical protein
MSDIKECRNYPGHYPTGRCPATECEHPSCIEDGPPLWAERTTNCPLCAAPPDKEHGSMCGLHPMQLHPLQNLD